MAARRRDPIRRGWPDNLYEEGGYFSYRNPIDGRRYGLGRDKAHAFAEARAANNYIAQQRAQTSLTDRITGDANRTLAAWIDQVEKIYERMAEEGKRSENTRAQDKTFARALKRWDKARKPIVQITTFDLAEFLKPWEERGQARMAQAIRAYLKALFRRAIAAGWCKSNPADVLETAGARVKRARLMLDAFLKIHAAAQQYDPWVQRSMELALVSGQRREDVAVAAFARYGKGRVWVAEGRLWVIQRKGGSRVSLPLSLRLDAVGWSLDSIVRRCRDRVVSRYLLHHARNYGNAPAGSPISINRISHWFQTARDASGVKWSDRDDAGNPQTPPTFHELRSLSARLYTAQGINAQELLGHRNPKSTALYRDSRGAEWIEVKG